MRPTPRVTSGAATPTTNMETTSGITVMRMPFTQSAPTGSATETTWVAAV
jgi:hypothetical protein